MPTIQASSSSVIDARPPAVWEVLTDYERGHRMILPGKYFQEVVVERGGRGAGTVIRVRMRMMGATRAFRLEVSEPEPGRVLAEWDIDTGALTTFTIDPMEGGLRSRVTIGTRWSSFGLRGWIERVFAPPVLRTIYSEELANLERVLSGTRAS